MNQKEQKELALTLFQDVPGLGRDIRRFKPGSSDVAELFRGIDRYRAQLLPRWSEDWPECWAFNWAVTNGDTELLRKFIRSSYMALNWALHIPADRMLMMAHIANESDAFCWACYIGDRDIMRHWIHGDKMVRRWNQRFKEEPICKTI